MAIHKIRAEGSGSSIEELNDKFQKLLDLARDNGAELFGVVKDNDVHPEHRDFGAPIAVYDAQRVVELRHDGGEHGIDALARGRIVIEGWFG